MKKRNWLLGLLLLACSVSVAAAPHEWKVPVEERTLANGLRVVVSPDKSAPIFGLCVTYGVGFRLEPKGSSGYAHLFEHMMFEGTPDAAKGVFDRVIEDGGGSDNADTRFDFTEYFETAPISALNPVLWLEADRMKGLDLSQKTLDNQRRVVEEEIRTNFLNEPYGQFYWLDLPQHAFDKFPNAHNFLGDFSDLGRATPETIERFFREYYAP
ncbi:MAG TPA: insulinase family protein, partial [Terriglobia bacterium]|nr:insulinase family protein [Terriglobia bacterium]